MTRSYGRILALSLALTGAVVLLVFCFNWTQPALSNGETLSREHAAQGVRLTGWAGEEITFRVEDPQAEYALTVPYTRPGDALSCNGIPVLENGRSSCVYVLPRSGTGEYHLNAGRLTARAVYLAESGRMTECLELQQSCNLALVAVMAVLAVYALSLYFFKPSEKYLLDLLIYQVLSLAWCLLLSFGDVYARVAVWGLVSRGINWMVIVITLRCCVTLTELERPRWLVEAMRWHYILLWAGGLFLAMNFYGPLRSTASLLLLLVCVAVLAYGAARQSKGVVWLLLGMCIRAGLSPMIFIPTMPALFGGESFLYFLLRGVHFIELPFLLGGMFCVNQKFAYQFSESERLSAHLDELVTQRTAELKALQSERQSMLLNITHDLRTPLFVIRSCLERVEDDPAALGEMLPILKKRSEFVTELTEDLFLLVKLQEGKLFLDPQREDLSRLLEELYAWLAVQAEEQKIQAVGQIGPELSVWGDRRRLQQLFQNLIANALHYTPAGGTVELRAWAQGPEEERQVVVAVRDTGKGIPKEDAEHIFERYFYTRAEHKHESSGLGLSIARELAILHHGSITFSSEEGRGTEFFVTLPLC